MEKPIRKAVYSDLALNKPLPFSLVDEKGNLLLRAGFVISMPKYIDTLIERGAYIASSNDSADMPQHGIGSAQHKTGITDESTLVITTNKPTIPVFRSSGAIVINAAARREPVFLRGEHFVNAVRKLWRMVWTDMTAGGVQGAADELAAAILDAINEDADATIASAYLTRNERDYRPAHQLLGAVITAIVMKKKGYEEQHIKSVICAAVTRDVGLFEFDTGVGNDYSGGLTSKMRKDIDDHAKKSAEALKQKGVSDAIWINVVLKHHDPPCQLSGDDVVNFGARILRISDSYAAMVLNNGRKSAKTPLLAMKEIHEFEEGKYCKEAFATMMSILTVNPPGSLAKLQNGEIATIRNAIKGKEGVVYCVFGKNTMPMSIAEKRQVADPEHKIFGAALPEDYKAAELVIKRLWSRFQ